MLAGGGGPGPSASPPPALADRALAGQRLVAGWDGGAPPRGLRRLIRSGGLAGLVLFTDNIPSRAQARRTLRRLQALPRPPGLEAPLLVMADQEGGPVRRLPGPPRPSAERIGDRGQSYARRQGKRTAAALRSAGINVDLAPVLDVARPGAAIEREQRSFGGSASRVIATGVEGFAAGLRSGGVAATAKHFPGLGAVRTNTDLAAQVVTTPRRRLRELDEPPFASFVDSGGEIVMLSLATYEAFADRPAALSAKVLGGELRGRLGYDGVTITDDLGAAAATAFGNRRRTASAAEAAGEDLLLYRDWRAARGVGRMFARGLRSGRLDRERFQAAAARVLALRERLAAASPVD